MHFKKAAALPKTQPRVAYKMLKLLNNNKQVALIVGNFMTLVNPSTDMMIESSVMEEIEELIVKK